MLAHRRSYWKTITAAALATLAAFALACAASLGWWPFALLGSRVSFTASFLFGLAALLCGAVAAGGGIALHRDALARGPQPALRGRRR